MYSYEVVRSEVDLEEAVSLVARVYAKSGYVRGVGEVSPIAKFLYDFTRAVTIKAYRDSLLVGTISIVNEGPLGLPMDNLFLTELETLRTKKSGLAEICQFAIDKDVLGNKISESQLAMNLLRLVIEYFKQKNLNYAVFAINPKHRLFYESIGAKQIGNEKTYESANNAPALGYCLDIQNLLENANRNFVIRTLTKDDTLPSIVF
jgi:hypothetical protein